MRTWAAIAAVCSLLCAHAAHAKARYMGLAEAVAVSDVIAEIEVTQSTPLAGNHQELPKKGHWSYRQKNAFRFTSFLKNPGTVRIDADAVQTLYAEKTFICGRASYAPGKYLVFIESVGGNEWITLNHSWGGLKIDDAGNVEGFGVYGRSRESQKAVPLAEAKKAIAAVLLDGKPVSCTATIEPSLAGFYNVWVEGAPSQKLVFHVYKPPKANWPAGLHGYVRAFPKADALNKMQYNILAKGGGTYSIAGAWTKGAYIIASIEKK